MIRCVLFCLLVCLTCVLSQSAPDLTPFHMVVPPAGPFPPLKMSSVLHAKALIRWLIDHRKEDGIRTFNAGFIRLAFHDCVKGCDGCVNFANIGNFGLPFYKFPLDLTYLQYIYPKRMMSRADFYALAGITAAEYASELSPTGDRVDIPFKWGRTNCENEAVPEHEFPDVDKDNRNFFREAFNLTLSESVALIGAHSVGRDNTVTNGSWVENQEGLDNEFYKAMLNKELDWTMGMKGVFARRFAFAHRKDANHQMFLSDMFLAYNMSHMNESICQVNPAESCPRSSTYDLVVKYASDNKFWIQEFSRAYSFMLETGNWGQLKDVIVDTSEKEHKGALFPVGREPVLSDIPTTTVAPTTTTNTTATPTMTTTATTTTTTTTTTSTTPTPKVVSISDFTISREEAREITTTLLAARTTKAVDPTTESPASTKGSTTPKPTAKTVTTATEQTTKENRKITTEATTKKSTTTASIDKTTTVEQSTTTTTTQRPTTPTATTTTRTTATKSTAPTTSTATTTKTSSKLPTTITTADPSTDAPTSITTPTTATSAKTTPKTTKKALTTRSVIAPADQSDDAEKNKDLNVEELESNHVEQPVHDPRYIYA